MFRQSSQVRRIFYSQQRNHPLIIIRLAADLLLQYTMIDQHDRRLLDLEEIFHSLKSLVTFFISFLKKKIFLFLKFHFVTIFE